MIRILLASAILCFANFASADTYFKISKISCIPEISYFEVETRTLWSNWIPYREDSLKDDHSMFYGDFDYSCNLGDAKTGVKDVIVDAKVNGLNVSSGRSKTISENGGSIQISINNQIVYTGNGFHIPMTDERYVVRILEGGKRAAVSLRHCISSKCKDIKTEALRAFNLANG